MTLLESVPNGNFQAIIKHCQELKEVDVTNINDNPQLEDDDLEFFVENISLNIVRLNLSNQNVNDDHVKILLNRCNKIKVLNLRETFITKVSLKTIRQYLNLTLEKLSVDHWDPHIFVDFLELKKMQRLKILNLYVTKEDAYKIHYLRQHLPRLIVRTIFIDNSGKILSDLNLIHEELD